ncbi:hypothetical protein C4588_08230 [Candidatus Parcubacteria bacterium]|jgi:hypothetical protein|nr:MAG: hypothetical protein C4588_08230 [Candidatus Parcubacteria bacterium]
MALAAKVINLNYIERQLLAYSMPVIRKVIKITVKLLTTVLNNKQFMAHLGELFVIGKKIS